MSEPTRAPSDLHVTKLEFRREELGFQFSLADHVLLRGEAHQWRDEFKRRMVTEFRTYLYARTVDKWPATWWDAVKERWFPEWAQKRWPVEWVMLKQVVPTLEAPDRRPVMYIPFVDEQRFFPHGKRPAPIQPYNLAVPADDIEWMAVHFDPMHTTEGVERITRVMHWLREYQMLEER